MAHRTRWVGLAAALALAFPLLPPAIPAAAAASPVGEDPAADDAATARAPLPVLTAVRAAHVGDVDRVVFRFDGGLPADRLIRWVDTLHHDGSGLPARVAGEKVLMVVFNGASGHDQDGSTTKGRVAYALPNVITAVSAGDFEGTVTFGLGVQKRTSFTVKTRTNPDRVVIDVAAGFPTTTRKIWLTDLDAVQTGDEPYYVPRKRQVRADAPAAAALHALFAGPTQAERADGLRLVRSRAWGFDDLRIADRIARLRLTRGCNSNGSTITVAGEIMPTLRQFPTVDWVKIYDPRGGTEQPTGQVDSIPFCLEP